MNNIFFLIKECLFQAISREINFTSDEQIEKFRLEQRVFLKDHVIEGKRVEKCLLWLTIFLIHRMVFRFRVCDTPIHKHLAESHRGRARGPNAARIGAQRKYRHRDKLL